MAPREVVVSPVISSFSEAVLSVCKIQKLAETRAHRFGKSLSLHLYVYSSQDLVGVQATTGTLQRYWNRAALFEDTKIHWDFCLQDASIVSCGVTHRKSFDARLSTATVLCRQLYTCHTMDTRRLQRLVSRGRSSLLSFLGGVRTTAPAYCVSKQTAQSRASDLWSIPRRIRMYVDHNSGSQTSQRLAEDAQICKMAWTSHLNDNPHANPSV